jgi:hypothetical protein
MAQIGTLTSRHEIAFVDAALPFLDLLVEALPDDVEIVLLDPTRDGLRQIAAVLAERDDLDAIHILSHGSRGALCLGDAVLDEDSLPRYQSALQTLGEALSDDGDLLLYGAATWPTGTPARRSSRRSLPSPVPTSPRRMT